MGNVKVEDNKYFEFCLIADDDFLSYYNQSLIFLKDMKSKNVNCVITRYQNKYLYAIEKNEEEKIKFEILNQIIKYIIEVKKYVYLKNNILRLGHLGCIEPLFLKALTFFDEENDALEVQNNFSFYEKMYLNEFCFFKLKKMINRWKEICKAANENSFIFSSTDLTFEIIRFLLSNVKPKHNIIFISNKNGKIYIKDRDNKILYYMKESFAGKERDNVKFILKILDHYSNKICIRRNDFEYNTKQNKLLDLLQNIFKRNLKIID